MDISKLVNTDDLSNIGINISKINTELESIKNTISSKCDTEESFKKLNAVDLISSRFTSWDYNGNHGLNNLLDRVSTLSEIVRIQDYNIRKKNKTIENFDKRIMVLEKAIQNTI